MGKNMVYEVGNLSFHYQETSRMVLDKCAFNLNEGEVLCILGPNGAGKSTLLDCLCGLLRTYTGEIRLGGTDIRNLTSRQIAQQVSYVQQKCNPVFPYSVIDFVMMGQAANIGMFQAPGKKERQLAYEALEKIGIAHLAMEDVTRLSGGEQQQVVIARAIVNKPQIILFDEPTAHLDYGKQITTLRLISKMANQGYSVVLTTHNPDHAILLGGTVGILEKNGKLQTGSADKVITREILETLYETELCLLTVEELSRLACLPPNL